MNTTTLMMTGMATAMIMTAAIGGAPATKATEPPAMAALDWISGHWCQAVEGGVIEEHWEPSHGGLLIGMGRTVRAGKAVAFEFMRLEWRDGAIYLMAQPNGDPPVQFRLTASGKDWARFENPRHDYPKRVEYRRAGRGLHAEIGGPGADGREKTKPFDYLPCAG